MRKQKQRQKNIADTLGDAFSTNSVNTNYSKEFQNYQKQQEKITLNFKSSNNEEYNNPFNLDELKDAISISHDTATGPDEIHYQMLKHLPLKSLQTLLDIFNNMWETGKFPESWVLATIIPIPKPGKDHTEPTNYQPIALTSCLCKTLERMINARLVWYLEINNLISPVQSGFHSAILYLPFCPVSILNAVPMIIWLEWKPLYAMPLLKRNMLSLCFLTWKKHMIPLGSFEFYVIYTNSESRAD